MIMESIREIAAGMLHSVPCSIAPIFEAALEATEYAVVKREDTLIFDIVLNRYDYWFLKNLRIGA